MNVKPTRSANLMQLAARKPRLRQPRFHADAVRQSIHVAVDLEQLGSQEIHFFVFGARGCDKRLHVSYRQFRDATPRVEPPASAGATETSRSDLHGPVRADVAKGKTTRGYIAVQHPAGPQYARSALIDSVEIPLNLQWFVRPRH
jgi:hypothetical protein